MRGPVPFNVGNHSFATSMQTGVILYTDPSTRGIQIKESRGQWRKRRRCLCGGGGGGRGLTWLLGWPRRCCVAFVQVRVCIRV